ncbi:MAG TPA: hypothetical protein DCY82_00660 [Acidimicrobiaceae bacterium]|nr:hypothetical protein [Acidimicrobiaceae bacterium]
MHYCFFFGANKLDAGHIMSEELCLHVVFSTSVRIERIVAVSVLERTGRSVPGRSCRFPSSVTQKSL